MFTTAKSSEDQSQFTGLRVISAGPMYRVIGKKLQRHRGAVTGTVIGREMHDDWNCFRVREDGGCDYLVRNIITG